MVAPSNHNGLGLAPGVLALQPHDPRWADAFETLARHLARTLPPEARIEHIGSTAVPGLPAKPILDLAVILPAAQHPTAADALVADGWIDRGPRSGWLFIRLLNGLRTHNLHLYDTADPDWPPQLAFRDRLRADAALRDAYAAEKARLIAGGVARKDYAAAKGPFIARALA